LVKEEFLTVAIAITVIIAALTRAVVVIS